MTVMEYLESTELTEDAKHPERAEYPAITEHTYGTEHMCESEFTEDDKVMELYNSQLSFMHSIITRTQPAWEGSHYSMDREELMGLLNLVFVQAYQRYDETKGAAFTTYIAQGYRKMIMREVNRYKHGLTHPYEACDVAPYFIYLLSKNNALEIAMKNEHRFLETLKEYYPKEVPGRVYGVMKSILMNSCTTIDEPTKTNRGEGDTLKAVLSQKNSFETMSNDMTDTESTAIKREAYDGLPTVCLYWMIQIVKGYQHKEVMERLTIKPERFFSNKIKPHLVDILRKGKEGINVEVMEKDIAKALQRVKKEKTYDEIMEIMEEEVREYKYILFM